MKPVATMDQLDAEHPDREDGAGEERPRRPTAVLADLARNGFGRQFEIRGDRLWCPSCQAEFEAPDFVVESAIPVATEQGSSGGTVYALRCLACGVGGTLLVIGHGPEGDEVVYRLK